MSSRWNTCRVCGKTSAGLVKYSTRHYAHAECAMQKWGAQFFARLTPWQASRFPYAAAEKAGCAEALVARAEQQP